MKFLLVTFVSTNVGHSYGGYSTFYTTVITEDQLVDRLMEQGGGTSTQNSVHSMQEVSEEFAKKFNEKQLEKIAKWRRA